MSDLAAALRVAIRVHADQRDKQGAPYLLHVLRVVEAVSDEAKVVAALHDVLEDADPGAEALAPCCLSYAEWRALVLLTHAKQEDYAHYIARITSSFPGRPSGRLAREVKLADLKDNLGRIPPLMPGAEGSAEARQWEPLRSRYEKAIAVMEGRMPSSPTGSEAVTETPVT